MGIVTDSDLNRIGSSPFSDKPTCKQTCTKALQGELKSAGPRPYPTKRTSWEAPPRSESFQGGYRNQLSHQSCQLVLSTPICSLARSPLHSFSPALLLHIVAAETCFMFSDGSCMFSCCCCCCCCWTSIYTIYAVITHQENSLTSCTWISLNFLAISIYSGCHVNKWTWRVFSQIPQSSASFNDARSAPFHVSVSFSLSVASAPGVAFININPLRRWIFLIFGAGILMFCDQSSLL